MKPEQQTTPTPKTPAMSQEQAADLAALEASAAGEAGQVGEVEEQQGPDLAKEIEGLAKVLLATLAPIFPSLKEVYTDEATAAAAQAIAGVCNKHGWMQGGVMGGWGEEIACVAIVGPLAFQTFVGVRQDIAARKPAAPAQREGLEGPDLSAPVPEQKAGPKVVNIGVVQQ